MKNLLSLITVFGIFITLHSQKNVYLTIVPKVGSEVLQLDNNYTSLNGDLFKLAHFNYYLSNLHLIHDGGQDLDLSDTVFLIKHNQYVLNLGILSIQNIESIQFGIGVPPILNTQAGANALDISSYPSNHPLSFQDPSMYWGWSAGYMHMIIGGRADANNDQDPEKVFELHNLGDANYHTLSLNVIQTNTTPEMIDVYMDCHVDRWMKNIPIKTVGIQHASINYNASIMLNILHENVFDQPETAAVNSLTYTKGTLIYQAENKIMHWQNVKNADRFQLVDLTGKLVLTAKANESGSIDLNEQSNGVYLFTIVSSDGTELNAIKINH
jgi:hypothetical protein